MTLFSITNILDTCLHKQLKTDLITHRKGRFIVLYLLVACSLSIVMGTYNFIAKPLNTNTIVLLTNWIPGLLALFYLKKVGKLFFPSQLICFGIFMATISGAYTTGGIYSLDLQPLIHIPVSAYILYNARNAFVWSGISILTLLAFYYLEFYTSFQLKEGLENVAHATYYVKRGMAFVYMAGLFIFYEYNMNRVTRALEKSKAEVDALHNEIQTQYKIVLDNVAEIILILAKDGTIQYVNKALKKHTHKNVQDAIGKHLENLIPDADHIFNQNARAQKEIVKIPTGLGTIIFGECTIHPITRGSESLFLVTIRNITEDITAEQRIEEMRQKLARDFHDELGNRLASISLRSGLLRQKINSHDSELNGMVAQIEENASKVYQSFRDFIWAIDNQSDYLSRIITHLKDFGEDFYQHMPLNFITDIQDQEIKNTKLPVYWSRQIVCIMKEAMTNAAKHSKGTQVELGLYFIENKLIFSLKDNGKGFDQNKLRNKRGLNNLEYRAKEIQGKIFIRSNENQGTLIRLECLLPY